MNCVDKQYIELVNDVLNNGHLHPTRAKINGNNVSAYTVFGRQARFKFNNGFPILTTKKVSFDTLAHELVWFLSGDSNIKYLWDNKVKIWDAWADKDGDLGFGTYGTLWRQFPNRNEPIDQIEQLIDNIETVKKDPTASCGRRLIVTAWHPYYVDKVGLPPCHILIQFSVLGNKLISHLYQRSCDLFLGVPFNITSYCLLTTIIAHLTDLIPYEFIHTYHDLHIYENHIDQVKQQIQKQSHTLPTLEINKDFKNIDDLKRSDLKLLNYIHSGKIYGEVAI